ncbi:MAG: Flp pilus assembly complex ATPase component TadA [Deltaproteobacteria bacterium]|nr:Flp pilus assembly complex ATPase component TadA [Deltaproteobacteria bacterium]
MALATSKFVSRQHVRIDRGESGWILQVLPGATPIVVDGRQIGPGDTTQVQEGSSLRIAEFAIALEAEREAAAKRSDADDVDDLQRDLHSAVLRRLDLRRSGASSMQATADSLEQIDAIIDDLLKTDFQSRVVDNADIRRKLLAMAFQTRLMFEVGRRAGENQQDVATQIEVPGRNAVLEETVLDYVSRVIRRLGLELTPDSGERDFDRFEQTFASVVEGVIAETPQNIQFYMVSQSLKKQLCDIIFGLGPLQDLLDTPNISEIMIVSPRDVYVESSGRVVKSNRKFLGDDQLLSVIERIVSPLGRRIDMSTPLVDARLKDGSRVNAVIRPLALKGPCLTIRRFPMHRINPGDLVKWRSLTNPAVALLEGCVKSRRNVLVAGGTGSGKTTMLNVLSSFIPESERIVTIEDAAELQLQQEHVVSLETRPANVEGKGAYTIRDLVKNALRMRPDRVIVGECRGEEAFDMVQAMNTGHAGSMTTVHSNSSRDALYRLETMFLMAVEIPLSAVRRQLSQALDIIVYVERLKGGRRMCTQITEVGDINPLNGEIEVRDIMARVGDGQDARLMPTGYMPSFLGEMVDKGLIDLDAWFGEVAA